MVRLCFTNLVHVDNIFISQVAKEMLGTLLELRGVKKSLKAQIPVDDKNQTPLHDAVMATTIKVPCVQAFVDIGLLRNHAGEMWKYEFLNFRDQDGKTALHYVVQNCSKEAFAPVATNPDDADFEKLLRLLLLLISNGADVTARDAHGFTPLHFVVPGARSARVCSS